jgi:protein-S-isoprenylcysteine O-methyltransferase Ste14
LRSGAGASQTIAARAEEVTILVPRWIARSHAITPAIGSSAAEVALQLVGVALGAAGVALFLSSLRRFVSEGDATLAPWDPPQKLFVRGPYRYVRNPMISGVIFVLFAESLLLLSRPHAIWGAAFLVLNLIFLPLVEEKRLEQRFGDAYRNYCRHVPRIWPRLTPWP